MKRRAMFAAGLFGLLTLVAADEAPPALKYGPAKAAVEKRDAAVRKALATFLTADTAADRQLLKDLDVAANQAMAAKNLDAANEVAVCKKAAEARLAAKADTPPAAAASSDVSTLNAKFHVRWNGGDNHLTLANGKARNTASDAVGTLSAEHGALVIRWDNGFIDRLTGVGSGVVLVESWDPEHARTFPDGGPSTFGRGDVEK